MVKKGRRKRNSVPARKACSVSHTHTHIKFASAESL